MDHIMVKIENFYDIYLDDFIEEHKARGHKNLKENSLYQELAVIVKSINLYREFLGLQKINLSADVKAVLGRGN